MDRWDIAIWVVAGFVAVLALVRMMASQRDKLVAKLKADMEAERQRQAAEKAAQSTSKRKTG